MAKLYEYQLVSDGFIVDTVPSGDEAVKIVLKNTYDVILLDIVLSPGKLNGFDVLEFLKKDKNLKNIPVVILTNLDTEEKVAKDIGAVAYFVKANTSIAEVSKKVKELIDG